MIDLITGLPGNCKTLWTISWVRDWAKKDNRAVFYSGIPLTEEGAAELGWQEVKAEEWMLCPPNSIVIIDECQKVFRNRSLGQIPPKHVTDLETHRHLGIDLVFITQHPSLIDPAIRRLTGRHRHMVRIMGFEASTVHEWTSVRDNCDKPAARKDSEKTKWKFDKSVYRLYKSAEVHTVKRSIPMRLKLLVFVPIVIGLAVYTVGRLVVKKPAQQSQTANQVQGQGAVPGAQLGQAPAKVFDSVADAKQYVAMNTPRVDGLQHTAPKYDDLTKPTRVPVPAACVVMPSQNRCSCYSQQATPMNVPFNMCVEFARNGYFQEFDPNGRGNDGNPQASVKALESQERLGLSGASTRYVVPGDSIASADGYGVNGKAGPGVRVPGVQEQKTEVTSSPPSRVRADSPWRAS